MQGTGAFFLKVNYPLKLESPHLSIETLPSYFKKIKSQVEQKKTV